MNKAQTGYIITMKANNDRRIRRDWIQLEPPVLDWSGL